MGWGVIRADASILIGSGHIMRCLSLANALQASGTHCVFLARHIPETLADRLKTSGHDVIVLGGPDLPPADAAQGQYGEWLGTSEAADAETCLAALLPFVAEHGAPALVICDHYGLSANWETRIGQSLGASIAIIDDLSNRKHDCQWLIDTTYGKTPADYDGLVPAHCQFMVGSDYALLRPEFAACRPQALARRDAAFAREDSVGNVLISMGGIDKDNVSKLMLEALAALLSHSEFEIPEFETHVLVGPSGPHLEALRDFAKTLPFKVIIHGGVNDVTPLFMDADICIGAAGSSTWERCCLGLPTINVVIADNQKTIAHQMSKRGALVDAGMFKDLDIDIFNTTILQPLLSSSTQRQALSLACRDVCDGHGVGYVVEGLQIRTVKHGKIISLKQANTDDIKTVYDWQCLPETRRFANNPDVPEWEGHVKWMQGKLVSSDCHFYTIQCDQTDAGVVRIDRDETRGAESFVVSIFIAPEFFGIGAASAALSILAALQPKAEIWAQVHAENTASVTLFSRAGYVSQGKDWYVLAPR